MVRLQLLGLELLLGQVLRRKVAERTVGVLGSVIIAPRLVVVVDAFGEDVIEMVLGCMRARVLMIWVARLSFLRVDARVDCCTLGNISVIQSQ